MSGFPLKATTLGAKCVQSLRLPEMGWPGRC